MKRVFFLTFMVIYLLGNAEFIQLFKLPVIFIHYKNHLANNEKLDFFYYLSSHYDAEGDGILSDNDEESKMPFMRSNHNMSTICFVNFSKIKLKALVISLIEQNFPKYIQGYSPELHALSLLRPPAAIS